VDKFPPDVIYEISSSAILIRNTVDHDIIVCIRDQYKKYLNHVYIRNNDEFLFTGIPITRLYVQYKSKEFFKTVNKHFHTTLSNLSLLILLPLLPPEIKIIILLIYIE